MQQAAYGVMKGEDVMTDFQFKALIKMVLDLIESNHDLEKVTSMLRELIGESNKEEKNG